MRQPVCLIAEERPLGLVICVISIMMWPVFDPISFKLLTNFLKVRGIPNTGSAQDDNPTFVRVNDLYWLFIPKVSYFLKIFCLTIIFVYQ